MSYIDVRTQFLSETYYFHSYVIQPTSNVLLFRYFYNIPIKEQFQLGYGLCNYTISTKFNMRQSIFAPLFGLFLIMACSNNSKNNVTSEKTDLPMSTDEINAAPAKNKDTATFGSGCFWCTEAVFQQVKGVDTVISGYSGGQIAKPTYKQVCSGTTGHAEVLQIVFNPALVSYSQLLEMFWYSHDPTTLNRQGNDEGTQYRSVVFYHNEQQKKEAEFYKKKLEEQKVFNSPIVTEISPLINFYPAEDYHQNYYNENSSQPYCMYIVRPKLEKFKKAFATKLK